MTRLASAAVTAGLPAPVTSAKVVLAPHPDHLELGLSADDCELGRLDPEGATEALAAYSASDVDGGTSMSYATALVLSQGR